MWNLLRLSLDMRGEHESYSQFSTTGSAYEGVCEAFFSRRCWCEGAFQ